MLGPQFLIIGAARSGTTALYQYLAEHPGLFLTEPKEPHHFALAGTTPAFTGPGDRQTINRLAIPDRDAYLRLYREARPDQVRGEASVSTMYYPHAVTRVREMVPDARLVCMLRDPVDRAFSAYGFMRTRGWEPCATFEEALADEPRRIAEGWHHIWHYAGMSRYGEQLRHVLEVFPREQLLVLRHEELTADPVETVGRLYDHLGVDRVPVTVAPDPHRSGEPRSRFLGRVISTHHPLKKVLSPVVPTSLRRRLRRQIVARNIVRTSYRPETRRELVQTFRADLDLLEQVTGLDVGAWRAPVRQSTGRG
ncbi:sulfotransferase [Geodermatophilus sabuli]|uniref:Sulfotransferase n=1 Tax=Geodermatophilus sabuli TaxID=1564158 RepID=A0A7K3W380_9ACTN|nr:sulfotransferase [Geodermatophilus sabuli]NEK59346.1 sulfotransferase [Geodermatophilus sabuli]